MARNGLWPHQKSQPLMPAQLVRAGHEHLGTGKTCLIDSSQARLARQICWRVPMRRLARIPSYFALVLILCVFAPAPVYSQSNSGGCTIEPIGGTSRHRIVCHDGLSIIVEKGARYTLLSRSGGKDVDAVRLEGKALLLDFSGRGAPGGVEVVTPQAIAAVRGTKWVVDVAKASTSVFVIAGRVEVRRSNKTSRVSLQPGEGVDVDGGSGPLTIKHWPASRVNALLSRLGQ